MVYRGLQQLGCLFVGVCGALLFVIAMQADALCLDMCCLQCPVACFASCADSVRQLCLMQAS